MKEAQRPVAESKLRLMTQRALLKTHLRLGWWDDWDRTIGNGRPRPTPRIGAKLFPMSSCGAAQRHGIKLATVQARACPKGTVFADGGGVRASIALTGSTIVR
jgi:hypothetical protein